MIRRALPFVLCASLLGALPSCGGGTTSIHLFSTGWTDDRGASMQNVRARLDGAKPSPGADVVVGVAGNGNKIVGVPLFGGGTKWAFTHTLDARPIVTGAVVVGSGNGELFALDALHGAKLWSRSTGGLVLHGAGDDGGVTVITLSSAGGKGSVLLALTHDGAVVRQIETDKELGSPAVLSRIAFVPWANQYVSAIDLSNGDEAGRVVLREKTSRAWTEDGALYFGEVGIFRFDDHIKDASRNAATHVALPVRELPGSPVLMQPGGQRLAPVANATDRIRLYARPSNGDTLGIENDRYYATYFRIVMGFDAKKGQLAWVHPHGADILGGEAVNGAVLLCDEHGKVLFLDAQGGEPMGGVDVGEPLKACMIQADQFRPQGPAPRGASLAMQLAKSLEMREAQLATVDRFLLRELAPLPDEIATKVLVELADGGNVSPEVAADARTALASRRSGARYMQESLARHADFMKGTTPPPVAPIAQALAAMKEKSAAPVLAAHLLDPADTEEDVMQAARALVVVGGPAEIGALRDFFAMYRAIAASDDMTNAVVASGQALLKYGGAEGRGLVDAALSDPLTVHGAKERLEVTIQQLELEKKQGEPKK